MMSYEILNRVYWNSFIIRWYEPDFYNFWVRITFENDFHWNWIEKMFSLSVKKIVQKLGENIETNFDKKQGLRLTWSHRKQYRWLKCGINYSFWDIRSIVPIFKIRNTAMVIHCESLVLRLYKTIFLSFRSKWP